jgi:hypothetical protein
MNLPKDEKVHHRRQWRQIVRDILRRPSLHLSILSSFEDKGLESNQAEHSVHSNARRWSLPWTANSSNSSSSSKTPSCGCWGSSAFFSLFLSSIGKSLLAALESAMVLESNHHPATLE